VADQSELRELIRHGSEERNLEYKAPMDWVAAETKAKMVKAALAMANIRDGGAVVIGMAEISHNLWEPVGLPPDVRDSYNQDHVMAHLALYADPYVEVTVSLVEDDTGKTFQDFVVIQVREFEEVPIVCRQDLPLENMRAGEIFTRTRRMYESARVPGQAEMREILDLAVDKGIRRFDLRAAAAGYVRVAEDARQFQEERGDL